MNNPTASTHATPFATLCLVVMALLLGCTSVKKTEVSNDAAALAVPSGPTASGQSVGESIAPQPSAPALMDLPSRFAHEASHRPPGTVTAEQVFDAIAARGMVLTERKQHLANPFGAMYCQGAKAVKDEQFFSVCEYASDAEAEKGVTTASTFGTNHRAVIRNGHSILIARYQGATSTAQAEQTFRSLKAPSPTP